MKIAVGADHAGYELKDRLAEHLRQAGHQIENLGTDDGASVDYPHYAAAVARAVAEGRCESGLLVCGTGIGMAMSAGKIDGVRAATCNDLFTARLAREHNDANVLTLGARIVATGLAEAITDTFFATPFAGERHARRVAMIRDLE